MKSQAVFAAILLAGAAMAAAQVDSAPVEKSIDTRYSVSVIDDATFYDDLRAPLPTALNQVLVEPSFGIRKRDRWNISASLIGQTTTHFDTSTQLHVKELYGGISAGDFDFMAGRKMVLWGTGYAFSAAGVLDPPRVPTNPTDRLNVNVGRDMVKADWVRGQNAISVAWSTAELAPKGSTVRDTTAFRYNVLVRGFDTSLIAGHDRGGDTYGAMTFTRVVGQALEVHGEGVWREQAAALVGAKYTAAGITCIGEFYTPPNIAYYRDSTVSPTAGRQHYAFASVGKARLRERAGWKEWSVTGSIATNLDDQSFTGIADVSRWFGNHFSAYAHFEVPHGSKTSEFGAAPYSLAASVGVRFQL